MISSAMRRLCTPLWAQVRSAPDRAAFPSNHPSARRWPTIDRAKLSTWKRRPERIPTAFRVSSGGASPTCTGRRDAMDARLSFALLAGRIASSASRRLGRGGGTVLPGHVIDRLDPDAARQITARLPRGVALVSGTNGKTTTTRMVARAASLAGLVPIHNRSGANLMAGIVAALGAHSNLLGHPHGEIGVFEADEAEMPRVAERVRPRVVALLNVFRDQLDRYGEVELIAANWRRAIDSLGPNAILVLNADDPIVAQMAAGARCRVLTFGIEDRDCGSAQVPHDADKRLCHRCGG